ncbi:hypothetical protein PGC35_14220 [Psychrobacillus sp. PGGUH221]|uniref:hypothetical protein n=1 Tax=Psychrobacillus sp. PGGUH221 TaxID=3020058 RepID=UPI0035C67754
MNSYLSLIKELQSEFGQVVEYKSAKGVTNEGWFLLEITPFPNPTELEQIVSDINNVRPVGVQGGKMVRLENYNTSDHIVLQRAVREALKHLEEQTYKVAVYVGQTSMTALKNQPIAIVIEPEISYFTYPYHPHINVGGYDKANKFYFPDSLCYTDNPQLLGSTQKERLLNAFSQISMWLFRHQVWEATRKYKKRGVWIGPETGELLPQHYPRILEPNGMCWCDTNKSYKDCHSLSDHLALANEEAKRTKIPQQRIQKVILSEEFKVWEQGIRLPKRDSLRQLNIAFNLS